jgi:hypothetical protein
VRDGPVTGMRKLLAAVMAACHLLVFISVPLLHTCHCEQAGLDGPSAEDCVSQPAAAHSLPCSRLCGLTGGHRQARWAGSTGRSEAASANCHPAPSAGACMACWYLQNAQSGQPEDSGQTSFVPARTPQVCPAISAVSPWLALYDYPARAPPAIA